MNLFDTILLNNRACKPETVQRMIILFDYSFFAIGDTLRGFSYLKAIKLFYPQASITINAQIHHEEIRSLVTNNTYLDELTKDPLDTIPFSDYDLVICQIQNENQLLEILETRYLTENFKTAVFSLSRNPDLDFSGSKISTVFPYYKDLSSFILDCREQGMALTEIFLSEQEIDRADQWLLSQGFLPTEKLAILIDMSSTPVKQLRIDQYFMVVMALLKDPQLKILIFDPFGNNKRDIYRQCLGQVLSRRIIVAEKVNLRDEISLMGATGVSLILGPCTGMMHCAAGIYWNRSFENPETPVPLMVVYAGIDGEPSNNKYNWWRNTLVKCLVVKKNESGEKYLNVISAEDQLAYFGCDEFTADLLLSYIRKNTEVVEPRRLLPAK